MTAEETLLEKFKVLPAERQQEVLDFAEFLAQKEAREKLTNEAIDDVFANRRDLLARLAEGAP